MPKINVPNDPDGLREFLSNKDNVTALFSPEAQADGSAKAFWNQYGAEYLSKSGGANGDYAAELRTQAQAVLFDLMRENGVKTPSFNIGNSVNFNAGRPGFSLDGTAALAHGRGSVYNKTSRGAALEAAVPEADRFHSIGEYCQAIRYKNSATTGRNKAELIRKLDLVESFQNSFSSEDPGAGGFLIPELMRSELFMLALEQALVRSRATVFPMSTLSLRVPAIDDTSHVSSVFGGVQFSWTEEAATIGDTQATFNSVQLTAKKLAATFTVPNELLQDAPAFSGIFDNVIPKGLSWYEDNAFMNESGVGTPQGFINCPAAISVPAESGQQTKTIVWENILGMYQSMLPTSLGSAVWIASHDTLKQLMTMALSVGTGGSGVMVGNFPGMSGADSPPMSILGRPVYFTEKVGPLGTSGDISFVDLSYYLIGDRQSVEVASSDQVNFKQDQTVFRLIERVDGRPWLQSALTPHNGSSTSLSAFVQLASR